MASQPRLEGSFCSTHFIFFACQTHDPTARDRKLEPVRASCRIMILNCTDGDRIPMIRNAKVICIAGSIAAGSVAISTLPASAASLTAPTLGGTAPTDVKVYCANAGKTEECGEPLSVILQGDSSTPGGNVELAASSEQAGFDFSKFTSLSGNLDGKPITLSSLTESDWGGGFAEQWLNDALTANGFGSLDTDSKAFLSNIFLSKGGRQRFSDPNISYVNSDAGQVKIGLAGHLNATPLLTASIDRFIADPSVPNEQKLLAGALKTQLETKTIQASELVKVSYNGQTNIFYSFVATDSGLMSDDLTQSHTGNYEIVFNSGGNTAIPEPSLMVGSAIALSGLWAAKRKSRS